MVTEEEGGTAVALGVMTMDTGGLQGGHHHHTEVVVTTLQGGHRRHIEVVGGIILRGAHLTTVADQGGNEQGLLIPLHPLTGVLKGTMVAVRLVLGVQEYVVRVE